MSTTSAVSMVALGVAINAVKDVTKKHDPFPTILAGGFLVFGVSALGDYVSAPLATAFAAVFFLGSFLISGAPFIATLNGALTSQKG